MELWSDIIGLLFTAKFGGLTVSKFYSVQVSCTAPTRYMIGNLGIFFGAAAVSISTEVRRSKDLQSIMVLGFSRICEDTDLAAVFTPVTYLASHEIYTEFVSVNMVQTTDHPCRRIYSNYCSCCIFSTNARSCCNDGVAVL